MENCLIGNNNTIGDNVVFGNVGESKQQNSKENSKEKNCVIGDNNTFGKGFIIGDSDTPTVRGNNNTFKK